MRSLTKEEGGFFSEGNLVTLSQFVCCFIRKVGLSNHLETQLELQKQDKVCCRISSYNRERTTKASYDWILKIQLDLYSLNILQRQVYE